MRISKTAIYGLAMLSERLISFLMLPVLAKSISATQYAIWAQSIVVAGVLTPIVLMGFHTAIVKYFPRWDESPGERDSVMLAMLSVVLGVCGGAVALVAVFGGDVSEFVYGDSLYVMYVSLLVGLLFTEALFEFLVGVLRATDRIGLIGLYTVLKGAWRIGVFLVVLDVTGGDFYKAFLAFVLAQSLFIVLMYAKDIPIIRILRSGFYGGRAHWNEVLTFSLPLVALAVLTGMNNFIDRFFITYFHGLDVVASYAATYSLASVAAFFYSVLGFTLFPALARKWSHGDNNEAIVLVGRVIQAYLVFLLPFIGVMALKGEDILALLTTEEYVSSSIVFFLLACNIGLFGFYQIAFYIVLLSKGSTHTMYLMGLVVILNACLNLLLVPSLGMIGAALAGFVSNLLLAGFTLYMSLKELPWRFPWAGCMRIGIRVGIMLVFIWVVGIWLDTGNPFGLVVLLVMATLLYAMMDALDKKSSLNNLLRL